MSLSFKDPSRLVKIRPEHLAPFLTTKGQLDSMYYYVKTEVFVDVMIHCILSRRSLKNYRELAMAAALPS